MLEGIPNVCRASYFSTCYLHYISIPRTFRVLVLKSIPWLCFKHNGMSFLKPDALYSSLIPSFLIVEVVINVCCLESTIVWIEVHIGVFRVILELFKLLLPLFFASRILLYVLLDLAVYLALLTVA